MVGMGQAAGVRGWGSSGRCVIRIESDDPLRLIDWAVVVHSEVRDLQLRTGPRSRDGHAVRKVQVQCAGGLGSEIQFRGMG